MTERLDDDTLYRVLYRLLHDAEARGLLRTDDHVGLGLSAEAFDSLRAIDQGELELSARKIARRCLSGAGDDGGLRTAFPRTLATLVNGGLTERQIAFAFVASPGYADTINVPNGSRGLCVEEAFHDFLLTWRQGPHSEAFVSVLRHEFYMSVTALLVSNRSPLFELRNPAFSTNGLATWVLVQLPCDVAGGAVSDTLTWRLYAATPRRLVTGAVPGFVGDILAGGQPARGHTGCASTRQVWTRRLRQLGLLGEDS